VTILIYLLVLLEPLAFSLNLEPLAFDSASYGMYSEYDFGNFVDAHHFFSSRRGRKNAHSETYKNEGKEYSHCHLNLSIDDEFTCYNASTISDQMSRIRC
jgi:hypothetical protein